MPNNFVKSLLTVTFAVVAGAGAYFALLVLGDTHAWFMAAAMFFSLVLIVFCSPGFDLVAGLKGLFLYDWLVVFIVSVFAAFGSGDDIFVSVVRFVCFLSVVLLGAVPARRKRASELYRQQRKTT